MSLKPSPIILMADDDADDRLLMQEALEESKLSHCLHFVEDGLELLDYLHKRGRFASSPRPNLILLDLNMPKMDGRQALEHIKTNTNLKSIPVVIFTTSRAEVDVLKTYALGAILY